MVESETLQARMLWLCCRRNYEDSYTDPGSPVTRRTQYGTYVLVQLDGQQKLLLEGERPVLPAQIVVFTIQRPGIPRNNRLDACAVIPELGTAVFFKQAKTPSMVLEPVSVAVGMHAP